MLSRIHSSLILLNLRSGCRTRYDLSFNILIRDNIDISICFTQHMAVIMQMLSRRLGGDLAKNRMLMVDPYFSKLIKSSYGSFLVEEDKLHFNWGRNIISYVTGKSRGRTNKLEFGRDVDMVYAPMMWGPDHWVGLCINLEVSHVTILDSYPPSIQQKNKLKNKWLRFLNRCHIF